jgi:kynureninase
VYLCGNSLGLQPVNAVKYVNEEMKRWSRGGVRGHFEGAGRCKLVQRHVWGVMSAIFSVSLSPLKSVINFRRHWAKIDDHVQAPMARVVGGLDSEVNLL